MSIKIPFKEKFKLKDRLTESKDVRERHPERIPVIIYKNPTSTIADIPTNKYLVPLELTVPQLLNIIRKRISIKQDESINIFVQTVNDEDILPSYSSTIGSIYTQYVESNKNHPKYDGYLYLIYSGENVFG